jgi:hypothetical protein
MPIDPPIGVYLRHARDPRDADARLAVDDIHGHTQDVSLLAWTDALRGRIVRQDKHAGRDEKVEYSTGLVDVDFHHPPGDVSAIYMKEGVSNHAPVQGASNMIAGTEAARTHLASRRFSKPLRRSFSRMYISLIVRYGFGRTRSVEHSCCSSEDSRSSEAELARLSGVAAWH